MTKASTSKLSLACAAALFAAGTSHAAPPETLNPGWSIVKIRPDALRPMVTGIDFLPDGRLVVAHWGGTHANIHQVQTKGAIYILNGVSGDAPTPTYTTFAEGLTDPTGMMVKDGKIYVTGGESLIELPDANSDGKADAPKVICKIPGTHARHEFLFGLAFKDGKFWMSPSSGKDVTGGAEPWSQANPNRGTTLSVDPVTGQWEVFAMGLREPNGIGAGPEGELFVPDVQGNWLPSNKLINIRKGRFYGFKHDPAEAWDTMKESPPAVYLPQGDVALAPGQPLYIHAGALPGDKFVGQMLLGDAVAGGIRRVFLEKVNNEYQGAVFFVTGGLEAGPNRLAWGPDGYLYVGMCGQGAPSWAYRQDFGLQKIKPNTKDVLEMVSVHSRAGGMEIAFTHAVNAAALTASNYAVRTWHYTSTSAYGGNAQMTKTLPVGTVQVSSDNKRVFLPISGLEAGKVVHIRLNAAIAATSGATLWSPETWYTLNAISNSQPFPSVNVAKPLQAYRHDGLEVRAAAGRLEVAAGTGGIGEVRVRDFRGVLVAEASGAGRSALQVPTAGWLSGVYTVSVSSGAATLRRVVAIP